MLRGVRALGKACRDCPLGVTALGRCNTTCFASQEVCCTATPNEEGIAEILSDATSHTASNFAPTDRICNRILKLFLAH